MRFSEVVNSARCGQRCRKICFSEIGERVANGGVRNLKAAVYERAASFAAKIRNVDVCSSKFGLHKANLIVYKIVYAVITIYDWHGC